MIQCVLSYNNFVIAIVILLYVMFKNRGLRPQPSVKSEINYSNSHNIAYFRNKFTVLNFLMICVLTKLFILYNCVKRNV